MTRKRRDLTDDEQTLWDHVAKKVKPLKLEKRQITPKSFKNQPTARPPLRDKTPFSLPPEEPAQNKTSLLSSTHRIRRVRKVEIQARLDLHGYTRDQARKELGQFLTRCQSNGYLWVLVITGKGRRNINSEDPYTAPARAILANLVPQWLEESAFRSVVSAYTIAKPQDGGAGALYVRLKRHSKN